MPADHTPAAGASPAPAAAGAYEVTAMARIVREIGRLDAGGRRRVVRYITDRYGDDTAAPPSTEV